jgi:hypothetical protein
MLENIQYEPTMRPACIIWDANDRRIAQAFYPVKESTQGKSFVHQVGVDFFPQNRGYDVIFQCSIAGSVKDIDLPSSVTLALLDLIEEMPFIRVLQPDNASYHKYIIKK